MIILRLLEIAPYFPPHVGGVERYVFSISKYLVKRGHEVCVLTSNLPKTKNMERINGVDVFRLNGVEVLGDPITWGIIKKLRTLTRRVDIVVTHGYPFSMNYLVATTRNLFISSFPRLVFTFHGYGFRDGSKDYLLRRARDILLLKSIMNNNDAIISLTHHDKELLYKYFCPRNKRIFVIPNGVQVNEYDRHKISSGLITKIKERTQNRPIILFIGRLSEEKRPQFLLRAAKNLFPDLKPVIIFIGDGPLRPRLIQIRKELALEDDVLLTGHVTEQLKRAFLSASDLVVLPSLFEGMPTVLLEAMASRKPIVATRIPGVAEIVEDGINGFLIDKNSFEELAEKVRFLLEDQSLARKMGEKGRKIAEENYDWKGIVRRMEYVFKQVI